MNLLSQLGRSLTPYRAGEQPDGDGWIKLNTNESPYPPSPDVARAITDAVAGDGDTLRLYPNPDADALRDEIARSHGLRRENIFVSNGSDEALAFAFAAFLAGSPYATPEIGYSFYPSYARLFGAETVFAPMDRGMAVDVGALLRVGVSVILANPNAPTTLSLRRDVIMNMLDALAERGQMLIVDEAYAPFADCSVIVECKSRQNLLVVRTLSKAHGLAGMRVGYAAGSPELIDGLARARDSFNSYPVDRLAQAAAIAAVRDEAYVASTVRMIIKTRESARVSLLALGFEAARSDTNFLLARHPNMSGRALFERLLEKRILVRHFNTPKLCDYIRITIGSDEEMTALAGALDDILMSALA